jgi:hypothetical protein
MLGLERAGEPLSAADMQSRLGGTDWGLLEGARAVKLKSGPAKFALEMNLASVRPARDREAKAGIGFLWTPSSFKGAEAACLKYALFLPDDFEFGRGGRLPGLVGLRRDLPGDAEPDFSTRYAWRADGAGDIHTHLHGWTTGRSMGNDRHGFTFPKGRWVLLEQEVVLNDIGRKNGLIRIWVDGDLRFEKSSLVFREASGPTAEAMITGVLSEVVMPTDAPGARQKLWLSPFELRWK